MAKKVYDFALDENFDLLIKDGDFVIIESTMQHQSLLLLTTKLSWRPVPFVGVGTVDFLLDDNGTLDLESEIQKQFELDGMRVQSVTATDMENVEIKAEYK